MGLPPAGDSAWYDGADVRSIDIRFCYGFYMIFPLALVMVGVRKLRTIRKAYAAAVQAEITATGDASGGAVVVGTATTVAGTPNNHQKILSKHDSLQIRETSSTVSTGNGVPGSIPNAVRAANATTTVATAAGAKYTAGEQNSPTGNKHHSSSVLPAHWWSHKSVFLCMVSIISGLVGCALCLHVLIRGADANLSYSWTSVVLGVSYVWLMGIARLKTQHQLSSLGVSMMQKSGAVGRTVQQRRKDVTRFKWILRSSLILTGLLFCMVVFALSFAQSDNRRYRRTAAIMMAVCVMLLSISGAGTSYYVVHRILHTLREHAKAVELTQQAKKLGGGSRGTGGTANNSTGISNDNNSQGITTAGTTNTTAPATPALTHSTLALNINPSPIISALTAGGASAIDRLPERGSLRPSPSAIALQQMQQQQQQQPQAPLESPLESLSESRGHSRAPSWRRQPSTPLHLAAIAPEDMLPPRSATPLLPASSTSDAYLESSTLLPGGSRPEFAPNVVSPENYLPPRAPSPSTQNFMPGAMARQPQTTARGVQLSARRRTAEMAGGKIVPLLPPRASSPQPYSSTASSPSGRLGARSSGGPLHLRSSHERQPSVGRDFFALPPAVAAVVEAEADKAEAASVSPPPTVVATTKISGGVTTTTVVTTTVTTTNAVRTSTPSNSRRASRSMQHLPPLLDPTRTSSSERPHVVIHVRGDSMGDGQNFKAGFEKQQYQPIPSPAISPSPAPIAQLNHTNQVEHQTAQMAVWQQKLFALKYSLVPVFLTFCIALIQVLWPWMCAHFTYSFPLCVVATNLAVYVAARQLPTTF